MKTIFRFFVRQKLNSFINLVGLVIGISASLLILTHIRDELSYDRFFPKSDRIYRVIREFRSEDNEGYWAATGVQLAEEMVNYFPEIELATHFRQIYSTLVEYKPEGEDPIKFEEDKGFFTDSSALKIFDLHFIKGNPETALQDINSMIITSRMALKYFGNIDPIGKSLFLYGEYPMEITGVVQELPVNSHFEFDFLIDFATFTAAMLSSELNAELYNSRGWSAVYTYILLTNKTSEKQIIPKLSDFTIDFFQLTDSADIADISTGLKLQPLTNIHLEPNLEKDIAKTGNRTYVIVFTITALFLLFIAGVNYVNIATSQSFRRMKEVGIKKVIGVRRGQLFRQFIGESVFLTSISALIAILVIDLILPLYNQLSGKEMTSSQVFSADNIIIMIGIVIGLGILSGIYPALFTSNFNPIVSIKGIKDPGSSANRLRKLLLIIQFTLSAFMIFSTLTMYLQMQFFYNRELGFQKDNLMEVNLNGGMERWAYYNPESLKDALKKDPNILSCALVDRLPGDRFSYESLVPDSFPEDNDLPNFRFTRGDKDYISTLGLTLEDGRDLNDINLPHAYIINQQTAKILNLTNPVGVIANSTFGGPGEIIGVIKDFHYASLHNKIEPMVYEYFSQDNENRFGLDRLLIRYKPGGLKEILAHLDELKNEHAPDAIINYSLMDENLKTLYSQEQNAFRLIEIFALLSVFIACLGLFGLSAYSVEIRTKEIGIRKTFGASVNGILILFSKDFMRFVLIALTISIPFGWYIMHKWLQNFAFHISITWWMIILTVLLVIFVAFISISYQALRAALGDPAKALQHE